MLNHLFATLLICLGVANTTPISNYDQKESNQVLTTPKKQNVTTNYTIEIDITAQQYQEYNTIVNIPSNFFPQSSYRRQDKWQAAANNTYINVIGNIYKQQVEVTGQDENQNIVYPRMVMNKTKWEQLGYDYNIRERSELLYIYQLTPYKFNVNTTIELINTININEWEMWPDTDFYNYEIYLLRNIYISTEYTVNPLTNVKNYAWAQYLNQQIVEWQPYLIARDIENVNNGFYYTKQQDLIEIGRNTMNENYSDIISFEIVPETNNYIAVEYIPCIRAVEFGQGQSNELIYPQLGNIITPASRSEIKGTNLIPNGTYEVVDIPGLMFEILGMPYAFVSQAFNLTLFPGTPYQINIANLFLSIIAIFVFVWLLLLFIKMKSGG